MLGERGARVACTRDGDECFDLLAARRWSCLILAADGAGGHSLKVLARCRQVYPEVPAVVLVRHGDTETAVGAMKAGAADCVEIPVSMARMLDAVIGACREAEDELGAYRASLTRMERTVLEHILAGRTNRQIANVLCRSPRTIEVHRRHIMQKLGVANLVELVRQTMGPSEVARSETGRFRAGEYQGA
jgi:two-component system response regulator FixJ